MSDTPQIPHASIIGRRSSMISVPNYNYYDHAPKGQREADRQAFLERAAQEPYIGGRAGKLTEDQKNQAVSMYLAGASIRNCADKFHVRQQSMRDILKRRTTLRSRSEAAQLRYGELAA